MIAGTSVGPYMIQKVLGHGGMSVVYLAYDTRDQKHVALKVLAPDQQVDRTAISRFFRGAQENLRLRHPNIVQVYETGGHEGMYYIAMQYVAGGSVERLLEHRRQPFAPERSAAIIKQVADALDFAHRHGVIHRDVKPSNILLSADGRNARLADFGIVRVTGRHTMTDGGNLVGTPEYMAPEQIQGRQVGRQADVYGLAVVLYQLVTGRLPFIGEPLAVLYAHVNTPPPSPSSFNPYLSRRLAKVVLAGLAKSPRRRFATAGELATAAQQAVHPQLRIAWQPIVAGILIVLAALLATLFLLSGRQWPSPLPYTPTAIGAQRIPPAITLTGEPDLSTSQPAECLGWEGNQILAQARRAISPMQSNGLPDSYSPPRPTYLAQAISYDTDLDLAILRNTATVAGDPVASAPQQATVPIGDSNNMNLGNEMTVLGFPPVGGETLTPSSGTVSGCHHVVPGRVAINGRGLLIEVHALVTSFPSIGGQLGVPGPIRLACNLYPTHPGS